MRNKYYQTFNYGDNNPNEQEIYSMNITNLDEDGSNPDGKNVNCEVQRRSISLNYISSDIFPENYDVADMIYTRDIQKTQAQNKIVIKYVYVLTKQQELFEFSEDLNRKSFDIKSSYEPIFINNYQNVQMVAVNSEQQIIVINGKSGFYINIPDFTQNSPRIFDENFQPRTEFFHLHYDKTTNLLFLAVGVEGVDIYKVQETGNIQFLKNLNSTMFDKTVNITDVQFHKATNTLVILDFISGLIFVNVQYNNEQLTAGEKAMHLQDADKIVGGYLLKIYHNLILIGGKNQTMSTTYPYSWIYEIFMNFDTSEGKINQEYYFQQELYELTVGHRYFFGITSGIQTIYPHSISYSYFPEDERYYIKQFVEYGLKEIIFINDDYFTASSSEILLLSYKWLVKRNLFETPFQVICNASESSAVGEYKFLVQYLTRNCSKKAQAQDTSDFSICHVNDQYKILIYTGLTNTHYYKVRNGLGAGLAIGFFILLIIGLLCCRRYANRLKTLKSKLEELKSQGKYSHINEEQNSQNKI